MPHSGLGSGAGQHLGFGMSVSQQSVSSGVLTADQMLAEIALQRIEHGLKNESSMTRRGSGGKIKRDRPVRHASPYNRFMSQEVKRIKAENPEVDHREAFKMAASNWARSPTACQKATEDRRHAAQQEMESESLGSITDSNSCVTDAVFMRKGYDGRRSTGALEELL